MSPASGREDQRRSQAADGPDDHGGEDRDQRDEDDRHDEGASPSVPTAISPPPTGRITVCIVLRLPYGIAGFQWRTSLIGALIGPSPPVINRKRSLSVDGGTRIAVRDDRNPYAPAVGRDGLYFAGGVTLRLGNWDWEIRSASPESGPSTLIGRVAGARFPISALYSHFSLSPSGDSLAMGLVDGVTTNIWTLGTSDGAWRQLTDFGDEPTTIARQVSWAPDGQHLYAAVCRNIGDVVIFDRLVNG